MKEKFFFFLSVHLKSVYFAEIKNFLRKVL